MCVLSKEQPEAYSQTAAVGIQRLSPPKKMPSPASQALLDQVFLGIYDTDPELTNGIEDASETFIYTTYGIIKSKFLTYAAVVTTHNYSDDNEDTVYYPSTGNSPVSLTQNSADNGKVVWATWALSPQCGSRSRIINPSMDGNHLPGRD